MRAENHISVKFWEKRKGEIRNPKGQGVGLGRPEVFGFRISDFGFLSDFGFRASDFRQGPLRHAPARGRAGFTLVEVVLAIFIAMGLLVVVLYFYRQSADLRNQLVQETDRLSALRLVLDRLTAELRTARPHPSFPGMFAGTAESIQFIRTEVPPRTAWTGASLGRVELAQTDLRLVRYELQGGGLEEEWFEEEMNNVTTGLVRTEQPLVQTTRIETVDAGAQPEVPLQPAAQPLAPGLVYLRFRYWNGSQWQASWTGVTLPQGVEVSLGYEIPEDELAFDEFEFGNFYLGPSDTTASAATPSAPAPTATAAPGTGQEEIPVVFRRIIYLPGSAIELPPAASMAAVDSTNAPAVPGPQEAVP